MVLNNLQGLIFENFLKKICEMFKIERWSQALQHNCQFHEKQLPKAQTFYDPFLHQETDKNAKRLVATVRFYKDYFISF